MPDAGASMFPRGRPRRRPFPVFPVLCGVLLLGLAAVFIPKILLDQNERQAYAQAQAIGRDYFKALASDAEHYQANFDNFVVEGPHRGMDFTYNRSQLENMRRQMVRYRALSDQHAKDARARVAALKIRGDVRRRYLADIDRTLADKKAMLERRLANQEAMLKEMSAMWDLLAARRGQWTASPYGGGVQITSSALFSAYGPHVEAYRRLSRADPGLGEALLAPEMWVSPPP